MIVHNVLWAASVLVMKKYAHAFHPFVMSVVGWLAGIFMCAGIVAIRSPQWFNISLLLEHPQAVWSIVYMAIFGSMIAYTAYQVAQQYLSATETSIFSYLTPIIAVPLSVIVLHESLTGMMILTMSGILGGVAVAEIGKMRKR